MSPEAFSAAERARVEERRSCVRALIQSPLLLNEGKGTDTLRLVRRHVDWLREWFHQHPAWHLHVESDFARLEKIPGNARDGLRTLKDPKNNRTFSRNRYVYLCLILAVIEKRNERQTVLGDLATEMERLGCGDPILSEAGLSFQFDRSENRQDLIAAVRVLIDFGVLQRIHGNEDSFLQRSGDVLYTIRRSVLARIICVRRGPSTLTDGAWMERLLSLQDAGVPESDDSRRRVLRTSLYRRLIDSPVVYYTDLPEDEQAYLKNQRALILRSITEATGLVAEVRAEGIAMVDPLNQMTDYVLPDQGTDGHVALLLCEELHRILREQPDEPIAFTRLEQKMTLWGKKHSSRWRRDAKEPAGQRILLRKVLNRLTALNLIRFENNSILPLPAIARYRMDDPQPVPTSS